MAAGDLTDLSNFLAHKWYREECGIIPTIAEHAHVAKQIRELGVFKAFTNVYDGPQAKKHRATVGRKV